MDNKQSQPSQNESQLAQVKVVSDRKLTWMWIFPLLALIAVLWLGFQQFSHTGKTVEIHFSNAQGLVEGRTKLRYQGLEIGVVEKVNLDTQSGDIYVNASIYSNAEDLLSKSSRFWLVSPKASLSGVSGLDALISGNYIAMEPNFIEINNPDKTDDFPLIYTALENAPSSLNETNGLPLTLTAQELDSISIGSKILYRKIPIGEVVDFTLAPSDEIQINVVIEEKYAHIINSESRFWNVSGIKTDIGFNGIDIQLESLSALLSGGIAVDSPENGENIQENTNFPLYSDIRKAGRGEIIELALPDESKVATGSPIMYKGIEIGQINNVGLADDNSSVKATATIQPAFTDYLNEGTQFRLEEAKITITEVENVANLVRGNFVTMIPGKGEPSRQFNVVRQLTINEQNNDHGLLVSLITDNSYGLGAGTNIQYRGLVVGKVMNVNLKDDQVIFTININKKYKHLVKSGSRFYINGIINADMSPATGLTFSLSPFKEILSRSISFDSSGTGEAKKTYRLYKTEVLANLARYEQSGSTTYTLYADTLPSFTEGSPVFYKNLTVGHIDEFSLHNNGMKILIKIDNEYKHLITANTVFWNQSGIRVKADLNGIDVTASPLSSMLNGGIAFDNIAGIENKVQSMWKLYDNYDTARLYGKGITLTTKQNASVTEGMPIKYQGVTVGEITSVTPDFNNKEVNIHARIYPKFVNNIAVANSYFWVVSPEISISGAKNLGALISPYIQVDPGSQKTPNYHFDLNETAPKFYGRIFYLHSKTKGSISIGSPVLYREIEVGKVTDVSLSNLAHQVITTISITPEYAYLVRNNTVFWNNSGLNVDIGLTGANIKAGTVETILRGGIAFNTPEDEKLQEQAPSRNIFQLQPEVDEDWLEWQLPIPKP